MSNLYPNDRFGGEILLYIHWFGLDVTCCCLCIFCVNVVFVHTFIRFMNIWNIHEFAVIHYNNQHSINKYSIFWCQTSDMHWHSVSQCQLTKHFFILAHLGMTRFYNWISSNIFAENKWILHLVSIQTLIRLYANIKQFTSCTLQEIKVYPVFSLSKLHKTLIYSVLECNTKTVLQVLGTLL